MRGERRGLLPCSEPTTSLGRGKNAKVGDRGRGLAGCHSGKDLLPYRWEEGRGESGRGLRRGSKLLVRVSVSVRKKEVSGDQGKCRHFVKGSGRGPEEGETEKAKSPHEGVYNLERKKRYNM